MRKKRVSTRKLADLAAGFGRPLSAREITPAAVQLRLSHRLKQIIGPGRRFSLQEAARLADINPRTLKAYVDGSACPNVARYGRLLRAFGPEVGIELAMMLGWEPRASNPRLPHTEDLRSLRDATAQALQAIDQMTSRSE